MAWHVVPAAKAALAEATQRWPNRNRASDGTIGDPAHSSRVSDHNPRADGAVTAFDLTCDTANGCDSHKLVREAVARGDKRIKYAISQRQIWSYARRREGWRPYYGPNPHDKHAHVSVERRHENDTSPWWGVPEPPPKPPVTPPVVPKPADIDGDDMSKLPVLRQGAKGQAVRNLQGLLVAAGRRVTVDGNFGPGTRAALLDWQRAAKAPGGADGVAGPGTWGRLLGLR
jgi:hypothetical protein